MKVLFIPDMRAGNPYQRHYAASLEAIGVEVVFGKVRRLFSILRSIREAGRVEIVHLHWTHSFIGRRGLLITLLRIALLLLEITAIRARGIRLVWTVHNRWSHEARFVWLDLLTSRCLARLVNVVIAGCPSAASEICSLYRMKGRSLRVVPIGAYPNEGAPTRAASRQRLKLAQDACVLLFFGFIRPYKGIAQLIQTFRALERTDARLCIVGRALDPLFGEFIAGEASLDNRILLRIEYVSDEELQAWIAAADAVVIPFERVLTTSSVINAMSAGRAIIAPKIGCVGDVLDDSGAILYSPEDADGLRRALEWAVKADLDQLGVHNQQRVMAEFAWERIAELTLSVYREAGRGT